jgi:indoleamine 2,3-dioxygenase
MLKLIVPITILTPATSLDIPPFMSYAASYALYNYRLIDQNLGAGNYENIRLIRAFEHGLNPKSSEAGFILTHIHMVHETGPLIAGAIALLDNIEDSPENTSTAIAALQTLLAAMTKIEAHMELMWGHSLPKDYISYRTFIFGITSQSMFPDGVIYQGTRYGDSKALYFRGESGANDSIIPLLDHLCEIPMPSNPLTDILKDFRSYRPKPHREFLAWVMSKSAEIGVRKYCTNASQRGDDDGFLLPTLYLKLLEHVRSFRWRHWLFAREYILKRTAHPTATGGSPIVTWLPNQLFAVMDMQEEVYAQSGLKEYVKTSESVEAKLVKGLMNDVVVQREKLDKEVRRYCSERGV